METILKVQATKVHLIFGLTKVDKQVLDKLLSRVQKSMLTTGFQQFCQVDCFSSSVGTELLWCHVIFSHAHASTVVQEKFFNPTLSQAF